ncbi:MAG: FHA domain-containing protein [Methylotenera sp.]|nr:FHA domain-containing protein [Oligoflexia bacterium]
MFKLTLVSAPGGATPVRGASYSIQEGETSIGRQSGNGIVLQSSNVSKLHCTLVVDNESVKIQDQGSSNGTFVNGVLSKSKAIRPGDRLSVGDFVFELSQGSASSALAPGQYGQQNSDFAQLGRGGNVIPFPGSSASMSLPSHPAHTVNAGHSGPQMPTDFVGKMIWQIETHVMPLFYQLLLKHEWHFVGMGLVTLFVLTNLLVTVMPLTNSHRAMMVREVGRRAQFMARQIVEKNSAVLAARAETKADLGTIDHEEGVRLAILTDLDNRIIAPGAKLNQYLAGGAEANYAVRASKLFRAGRENGMLSEIADDTVIAIEPVKVLDPQQGKNITVGMAIVSVDTTLSTPGMGEIGVVYSETLIMTGIIGAILFFILYRLTLKPFQVLNDDIDHVLKGDTQQVTREFKFQEMNPLWDIINSALKRVSKSDGSASGELGGNLGPTAEDLLGPLKMFGVASRIGLVICDAENRILHLNPLFEEISGIRADNVVGSEFGSVARDQAFVMFTQDLFSRASAGGEGVAEDFEFSGVTYRMHAVAFGSPGGQPCCYVLAAVKPD